MRPPMNRTARRAPAVGVEAWLFLPRATMAILGMFLAW